jgi:hypothetical protein
MKHIFLSNLNSYAKKNKEKDIDETSDEEFINKMIDVYKGLLDWKPGFPKDKDESTKRMVCRHKDIVTKHMDHYSKLSNDEKSDMIAKIELDEKLSKLSNKNKKLLKEYIEDLAKEYLKYFDKVEKSL